MPKIILNPMFEGVSGRTKGVVFCKRKMVIGTSGERQGYIRSYTSGIKRSIRQSNNRLAFQIITSKYNQLKQNSKAFKSWVDQANKFSSQYTTSPRSLFYSFYLAMWNGQGSGWWRSNDLIISGGYGRLTFGITSYGTNRLDYSNWTWNNRFNVKFV